MPYGLARTIARKPPGDRRNSLLGLGLARLAAREAGFHDLPLAALRWRPGAKPRWHDCFDFNISHAGDLVVCSFSADCDTGVDVERFGGARTPDKLLQWTAREAVAKCADAGGLAAVNAVQFGAGVARLGDRVFYLRRPAVAAGFQVCLALTADAGELRLHELDDLELARA